MKANFLKGKKINRLYCCCPHRQSTFPVVEDCSDFCHIFDYLFAILCDGCRDLSTKLKSEVKFIV